MLDVIKSAFDAAGGPQGLAAALGIKRQAFYQWNRVPAERVLEIERATNGAVTRHQLRPDLYPPEEAAA